MVRRLVQHQKLRLGQQQARQTQPRLFAAGQQVRRLLLAAAGEAETGQHALNAAGPFVAARVLKAIHQPGIGAGELVEGGGIVVLFGHFSLHLALSFRSISRTGSNTRSSSC